MQITPSSSSALILVAVAGSATLSSAFVESPHTPQYPSFVRSSSMRTDSALRFSLDGNIELPNFGDLFDRIQEVSPLARQALKCETVEQGKKGLAAIDDQADQLLRWKRVENNPRATVQQIDKIDRYGGLDAPLLRFRSSMKGPLVFDASLLGTLFGRYIIDLDERKKWDAQIEQVYELSQMSDLDAANAKLGLGQFGKCSRLGIGYGQTKKALGITSREQLFLYGMQELWDGSSLIWGTEMDEKCNHLLPDGQRHTRAKSHLFAATLVPTGEDSFDIEYILQLSIGGGVPLFLTTPVMVDTVKNLFKVAEREFNDFSTNIANNIDGLLSGILNKDHEDPLKASLLMTP